jgi:kumamolisin
MTDDKIALAGSDRSAPAGQVVGDGADEIVHVTVVLRPGPTVAADIESVAELGMAHGLVVEDRDTARRVAVLTGPAGAMQETFGTRLRVYRSRAGQHRGRSGPVMVPRALAPRILAVLGLDNRRAAQSRARVSEAFGLTESFTVLDLAKLYDFPQGLDGAGQSIGIIALGGGYLPADLRDYFAGLGLAVPHIEEVPVHGVKNTPGVDELADRETALDIQIAGAIAPGARIVVYFAENSEQGLHDAMSQAVHDGNGPGIVSTSWGGPEESWTDQLREALGATLDEAVTAGVTVLAAAGDDGPSDALPMGLHVDLPACLAQVLACGGTRAEVEAGRLKETVWNDEDTGQGATGGGVSRKIPVPAWQGAAGVPAQRDTGFRGRGVPDVAANADPLTGYRVRINGAEQVVGGTSAVSPLWAGLIARINQRLGKRLGYVNPALYGLKPGVFREVVAGSKWNAATGLGTPNGRALLASFGEVVQPARGAK